jgi:TonB-dependent starch-binding outer membrane protein SusC
MRGCITAFVVFLAVATVALAEGTVQGTVIDRDSKESLVGATVVLIPVPEPAEGKGITYGAYVGKNGMYVIDGVPAGTWKVKVTYVGYKQSTRTVEVADDKVTEASFEVAFDPKKIEEVVVLGIAAQHPKTEAEIAVSRIEADQLQEANTYTDLTQLMMGKAAGVNVQSSSGTVGGGQRFTVRGGGGLNGNGTPLVFVDGVRIVATEIAPTDVGGQGFSTLSNINPQDIANIEILKGPAGAALYGTAGSNGVVLITTKRGTQSRDNLNIFAGATFGWNEVVYKWDSNEVANADNLNNLFKTGPIQEYNVSMNGNAGGLGYFVSYGRRDEQGFIAQNSLLRESVRGNFSFSPISEVSVSLTGFYSSSDVQRPQGDNNIFSIYANNLLVNPDLFGGSPYIFGSDSAALSMIENNLETQRYTMGGEINYKPSWAPGLYFRGVMGFDGNNFINEAYLPQGIFYSGVGTDGNRTTVSQSINRLNFDVSANYAFHLTDNIQSTTHLGIQAFDTKTFNASVDMQGYASPKIRAQQSAAQFLSTSDGVLQSREAGLFLNEEVVIDNTYFISGGGRLDHTTLLNSDAIVRFLPRISAMVRLDMFDFLPETFNLFKVRAAYGQSGQPPSVLAADAIRWATDRSGYGVGYVIGSIGNPDIALENITELEFGLEFEIDSRYGLDFTYYMGSGRNSIVNFPNTPSTGLTATGVPRNVGGIDNWGFEANAYASVIRTADYGLDFNLIVNNQNNEVTDLGGAQPIGSTYGDQYIEVGYSRSSFFGFVVKGAAFDENGMYAGAIYGDSLEYVANAIPEWTGSFGTTFRFLKHFSLYGLLEWSTGYSVMNLTKYFQTQFGNNVDYNRLEADLGLTGETPKWTPGSAEYKEAAERFARYDIAATTNYVESGDWLRVREISLRIDATEWIGELFGGKGLKGLNAIFSARNVVLVSGYSGVDPESNADGGQDSGTDRAVEFNTLPQPAVFNFTLNFTF